MEKFCKNIHGLEMFIYPKILIIIQYLGISEEELSVELNKLQDLNFISIFDSYIEGTSYIRVQQDEIIKFKLEQEKKNFFGKWDDGLKRSQNPVHKKTRFCDSTNKIREFLEEHSSFYEKIPMIMYSDLNDVVRNYENKKGKSVFSISDLQEYMFNMVQEKDFDTHLFEVFVNAIYKLSET